MSDRKNFLLFFMLTLLAGLVFVPQAQAQSRKCGEVYKAIITLDRPVFGFPTVWDALYKKKGEMTSIQSVQPYESGEILTLSRIYEEGPQAEPQVKSFALSRINRRGRILGEMLFEAKKGELPIKIMKVPGHYVYLGNYTPEGATHNAAVRMIWFDDQGQILAEHEITADKTEYEAYDIIRNVNDDGLVLSLEERVLKPMQSERHGMMMGFSYDGQKTWERFYKVGVPNSLQKVVALASGTYIGIGDIQVDYEGRIGGWLVSVTDQGGMLWQRSYKRGEHAMLKDIGVIPGKKTPKDAHYVVLGEAEPHSYPSGQDNKAVFLFGLSAQGNVIWERYYKSINYDLSALSLEVYKDGRMGIGLNAEYTGKRGGYDHIRLVTLSALGEVMQDEAYMQGAGAQAAQITKGMKGERIVAAKTRINPNMKETHGQHEFAFRVVAGADTYTLEDDVIIAEHKGAVAGDPANFVDTGWLFVATPLDPYKDPCK